MLIKVIFKREVGQSEGTETDGGQQSNWIFADGSTFKEDVETAALRSLVVILHSRSLDYYVERQ